MLQLQREHSQHIDIHAARHKSSPDFQVVNNHGNRKSPKDQVVGPLPKGRTLWLVNGGCYTNPKANIYTVVEK